LQTVIGTEDNTIQIQLDVKKSPWSATAAEGRANPFENRQTRDSFLSDQFISAALKSPADSAKRLLR